MLCQSRGGRWKAEGGQLAATETLPLRCVGSSGEEGETVMGPEAWLLPLTTYFFGDCCTPGWFQKT